MSVLEHTVVSHREGERLYIWSVFDWCGPFVTVSLLFVAPVRRQASASSCGVVLGSPQVSGFGRGVASGCRLWFTGCFCGSACLRDGDWEWSVGCGPRELRGSDPDTHSVSQRDAHRNSMTWTRIASWMCWACMPAARNRL